jgi:hypothetical protein
LFPKKGYRMDKINGYQIVNEALLSPKTEGSGELTPEQEQKIIDFVKSNKNLDDTKFHDFVESMGIDPHEAEEVVYRYVQKTS